MEREIDLATADRDVLIGIIVRQQASIERLGKRIAQLEGLAKSGGSRGMPGLKPKADRKPGPSSPVSRAPTALPAPQTQSRPETCSAPAAP